MSTNRPPVAAFLAELEEIVQLGRDFAAAMFEENKVTVNSVGRARCPWCRNVVVVMVLVGRNVEDGTVRSGSVVVAPCEHGQMIQDMTGATDLMLPEEST